METLNNIINYLSSCFATTLTAEQFIQASYETLIMVFFALVLGSLLGIPLGICLVTTRPSGLLESRKVYRIINPIINLLRSLPFIILLVAILPFTKLIVGSSIGTAAAIVPLTVYVAPYIARLVENSLLEVNSGIIEAAESMGATPLQIIWHFMLPEAFSSLILTLTTATIGLISATAMAGAVGAGGIGDLAISYGYQRFDTTVVIITVVILIITVQLVQSLGNYLARKARHE
ncbi:MULTISPECIES: methionine ABC transporter permease [unclassified Gilliamella]|uniref:methionine ABC transporter permease n=1 Tax=unclassified Gilliamella TaxID=2685620 RepID=UPI002269E5B4|nr:MULTISPECIES: methionine ABC transporter permease [unclassified Gilliamella]MCX8641455.1 ABC transporter permease [Gilliamella sp. B3835]MCX8707565.1 ABC transporter permease [Gilliamella sp. B3783]MCX8710645.1 ABC transporter permease [Gilliamella sp. B3780]MCX8711183.1 ABC transporter permease [Gilliamella sp. B3468]MCX8714760.1 ABC transporter permease [Gilliamella sp. B3781]